MLVPVKRRVDYLCELGAIRFVETTGVHPKVLQAVTLGLFFVEPYLAIASLALALPVSSVRSAKVTSSAPHLCERIAYRGILSQKKVARLNSLSLLYSSRRII